MSGLKSIGLPDIAVGLWEYNKAKKAFNQLNITEENYTSKKRFYLTLAGYGAIKAAILGFAVNEIANPILTKSDLNSIDIGLLATFGATYALAGFSSFYSKTIKDEALGFKHLQSKILNQGNFINPDLKITNIPIEESYQLFMFGNKLRTGNPVEEFIFKIKSKVIELQSKLNIEEKEEYNIVKKSLCKILKATSISSLMNDIGNKSKLKKISNDIIREHSDFTNINNLEFMSYIKKDSLELSQDIDYVKSQLKEINQEAILKAYDMVRIQNIQLFFTRIIIDYNDGKVNENIIRQFRDLKNQNIIKSKGNVLEIVNSYSIISNMAQSMLDGKKLDNNYKDPLSIIKNINPDMIDKKNKLIKTISFNNAFLLQKRKIINDLNNKRKIDPNIYNDKKIKFDEISYDIESFKSIVQPKNNVIPNTLNNIKRKIDI